MELSTIEREKIRQLINDPVTWAKTFIISNDAITKQYGPWVARDYQEEMLRDKSHRKVYRCGRRCLPEWVKILDPVTGELTKTGDLFERGVASVATMDDKYKMAVQNDCPVMYNGEKEVFRVTLGSGKCIDATKNHPLYTANGWKEIKDLKIGDYIATPSKLDFFGKKEINLDEVKLLAYMIGDGNCLNGNLRFTQAFGKQLEEMKKVVQTFGCELYHYESSGNEYDYAIRKKENIHNRFFKNNVKEKLLEYGVYGHGADDKIIPKEIFLLTKEQISVFLSRLYSTDGWASCSIRGGKWCCEIGYASNSEELIRGIGHLLLRYGIKSRIKRKTEKAWIINIYDKNSLMIFANDIGIYGKEDAINRIIYAAQTRSNLDSFMPKDINVEIEAAMEKKKVKKADIIRLWDSSKRQQLRLCLGRYKLQKWRAKKIADYLELEDLSELIDGDIEWEEIKSIESIGNHKTYDLTVPNTHNFVANDIITHNTGKSEVMVVDGLHKAFTHKNFRILYVTPYENQVRLLFMRMKEIIMDSPLLKAELKSIKSNPYMIEWKNGSAIIGFTTGASTGQGAASVRGQRADWIFLDEMDYMGENDYGTISMIAGERSDIGMTVSSTPTGKRGTYYQLCMNKELGYSEHHHPSTHNPSWNDDMEAEFKGQLTSSEFEHEIMAEFGTEDAGVFDKDKLDMAFTTDDYAYQELDRIQERKAQEEGRNPRMFMWPGRAPTNAYRTMGIDWDRQAA